MVTWKIFVTNYSNISFKAIQGLSKYHRCFLGSCDTVKYSVQFSCSVVSDYLWPHGLQHARPNHYSRELRLKWVSHDLGMPSNILFWRLKHFFQILAHAWMSLKKGTFKKYKKQIGEITVDLIPHPSANAILSIFLRISFGLGKRKRTSARILNVE